MKTLIEYLFENLILEKNSWSSLSNKLADKIINLINSDSEVENGLNELEDIFKEKYKEQINDNTKIYKIEGIKFKDKNSTLYILYNKDTEGDNTYANDVSFKSNKNYGYIIINVPKGTSIENFDDTISHEIRHYYDDLTDNGSKDINRTYTPGQDEGKYEGFLYRISPTEQNAFYSGFKKWLNKNSDKLKDAYKKVHATNIDDFLEKFSKYFIEKRHKLMKENNKDNELELSNENKGEVENPVRILEYKYYILNSFDNFKTFIEKDLSLDKERSDKDKEYIIKHLSVFNNGNTSDLNKIYKNILSKYKNTFNNYKNLIDKYLK